jgi:hypothetical protein
MRLFVLIFSIPLLFGIATAASHTIALNPEKRLKAVISCDSMNRFAVANDRITQVFGDQEAYEVQTEESTGQVFLKPTQENGNKPLSITLITEAVVTQDMTLEPQERDATTVILKNTAAVKPQPQHAHPSYQSQSLSTQSLGFQAPNYGAGLSYQEQVIFAMKQLVAGDAPSIEEVFNRNAPSGLRLYLINGYQIVDFKGFKVEIQNMSELTMDILEKDLYQQGDLAFCFEKRVLAPGEVTVLYVVTR